jgi:hypothetical protein
MDPITTAVLAAAAAGAASGATEVGKQVLVDSYNGLKGLIASKFGKDSDVADAVIRLEKEPDSQARRALLAEEVTKSGADKDDEVRAAAEKVQAEVQQEPNAQQIFNAINSNVGVMGTNYGTVNMDNRQQTMFNQSGQTVGGDQYNSGRDMSIGGKKDKD